MREAIIAPSILAADLLNLHDDIKSVEQCGADWHHIDVMDGHFVPNLSFGLPLIQSLKKITSLPLDVHIMVSNPDDVATQYIEAGCDLLTFHFEASKDPSKLLQNIQRLEVKAGIAINPNTPIENIRPLIKDCDLILLMSVYPGFGGQDFITDTYKRLETLKKWCDERPTKKTPLISVDGGVKEEQASALKKLGANALVAGSYIYQAKDRKQRIHNLKYL